MDITNINLDACPLQYLSVGYVGETGARPVKFDFDAWATEYGSGVLQLLLQRPGDANPYPVLLDIDGTTATWTPDATDTAAKGQGQAQLAYTVGGVVVKNAIFRVLIAPSLGAAGNPPEPYEDWLQRLTALAAQTQQSALDAAESAEAAGTSAGAAAGSAGAAAQSALDAEAAKTAAETAEQTAQQAAALARAKAAEASEAAQIAGREADYAQQQNIAAGYSAESAHDDAERAAQSAEDAQAAAAGANQAKTDAQSAASAAAGSAADAAAAVTDVGTKGAEQITAINQAGTTQIAAVDAAGAAQVQAIEDKGEEVIASIPSDYTELEDEVSDLKSAIVSDGSIVNNIHNLVDYKYHAKYFRNPNPSSDNSLKLGIKRFETYIVLNGVLDYTSNTATRVRLNGNVATTITGGGVEAWTTDTVAFVAGHFYRAELKVISGTASTAPAIAIIPAGSSSFISTGSRPDAYTYIAEFTASQNTEYNIVLYCNKNATFTDASMYVIIHDVTAENESIKNNINGERIKSLEDTIEYGTRKKWEQSDFTQGVWQSQAISASPNSICINALYPVNAGDVLRIQNNTSGLYFAYGVYVGSASGASDQSGWITGVSHEHVFAVSGKMFFQCVTAKASADRQPITPADMNFDVGIMDNGFVVETAMLSKQILPEKNKTIAFLGDSITAGVGTSKIYHMYLGERFGWTCRNYGYGGSGYARSYPSTGGKMATGQVGMGVTITSSNKFEPNDFLARIATIDTTVDGLVIFGGTNDWAHGDTISVDAFKTAVNNVFTYAQTHFGRIPIIVLLPIHRGNDTTPNATTGKTLEDYCDIIKEIAVPYGIRCIDLFAESGLNPANQNNNDLYYIRDDTSVSDSLHPNHYAHKMISNIIASALYDELY